MADIGLRRPEPSVRNAHAEHPFLSIGYSLNIQGAMREWY
jgi:hypothetical protein